MFQTEINHFFQSFATDELTTLMRLITGLGYPVFLMIFLIILLLAVDFKKAFLLFLILLWTIVITFWLKDHFDLPRPFHVDNTLQLLDGQLPDEVSFSFSKKGATSFWETLPAEVLAVTKKADGIENGFPSGHSSGAIALWGALALLFRKRWLSIICFGLMLLIPFSRIYLGVHFLADVVGGVLLGVIVLCLLYSVVLKPDKLATFLAKETYQIGLNSTSVFLLICPLLGFLFLPEKGYMLIAHLLGFGFGFLVLARKGLPKNEAPLKYRIGRTLIGISIFIVFRLILKLTVEQLNIGNDIWVEFFENLFGNLMLMWIGVELSIKLGWFQKHQELVSTTK